MRISTRWKVAVLGSICLAMGPGRAMAQVPADAPVKVSTVIHADGSKATLQTNPTAGTVEMTTVDAAGRVMTRTVTENGPDGKPLRSKTFDGRERLLSRSEFKKDGMGRVFEEQVYSPTGALIRRVVAEFGASDQVVGTRTYGPDGRELRGDAPTGVRTTTTSRKRPPSSTRP